MHFGKRIPLLVAGLIVGICMMSAPASSFAQTPVWTFAQLNNGTGGSWFAFPTGESCGLFHLYAINGSDPNGVIFNPGGTLNKALPDGTYAFTLLGDDGSGSLTAQRDLHLQFNGSVPLQLSSAGPASVSVAIGSTTITASNLIYIDPLTFSGVDRIGTCQGFFGDGYPDTIAMFTLTVSTQTPQQQLGALQTLLGTVSGLGAGDVNALSSKLQSAISSLDRGNTNAAGGQLGAFINQANALVRSRRLTSAQAQPLIDAAQGVLNGIE